MELEAFRKLHPAEFYRKFLVHSVRPDGRPLSKARKTTVTTGSIKSACGSAFVKIGNTSVCAGVKAECGPAPSSTDDSSRGTSSSLIYVNVELTPLCSPHFKPGKPSEQAQYIATTLNRLLRTTELVDESVLWIKMEESRRGVMDVDEQISTSTTERNKTAMAWYLYVDMYCLDYDGNVFDACLIALLAALTNVRLPVARVVVKEDTTTVVVSRGEEGTVLSLRHWPIPLTFAIFDEVFVLADPTAEEESLAGSTFTIIFNDKREICSVLKAGGTTLSEGTLKECMERAKGRVDEVLSQLLSPLDPNEQQQQQQQKEKQEK